MDIEDVFPEDPFEPTVKYVGSSQTPFAVPWAEGSVQILTGFNTQRAQTDDLFISQEAFDLVSRTTLQYRESQKTSIRDDSSSSIANSSEDRSFAISASVGGSFLGASGRGAYEKSVRDSRNTSNLSVRVDHICGQIDLMHPPPLSKDAVRLLNTSSDPINEFRQTYGDFYVTGYLVGAVNNTTISGDLANKTFFEAKRAEVEVKAFFLKTRKFVDETIQSANDVGRLTVAACDSLTPFYRNFAALTYEDSIQAGEIALMNKQNAMTIASRAADTLREEFSLERECTLHQDTVDRLCDRGLVRELLLAPFTTLREYQSLISRRSK